MISNLYIWDEWMEMCENRIGEEKRQLIM